ILRDALIFANGRLRELADIFGVTYAFAGHFSQLDADLECIEAVQAAVSADKDSYYLQHAGREDDVQSLQDLLDMLRCIRSGMRPVKIDIGTYPQGSPERQLAEAVSACPPGRRRTILNGILNQATAALQNGRSILEAKEYKEEEVILTKNQPNDTVFAVLSEGIEVINPDTGQSIDIMDTPNVLGEISAGIEGGCATATCRVRKGYTVTLLGMKREHFVPLLEDEEFADDYGSLTYQRLVEQEK
ncbi:hypothetical protein HZA45_03640, partial [Candidatus Peregrinibacteria bacterium]|nr:hypothetical protein [Candidatus Peregrinibacteria bacterium]